VVQQQIAPVVERRHRDLRRLWRARERARRRARDLPELQDPDTGRRMMERTLLVATHPTCGGAARGIHLRRRDPCRVFPRPQGYDVVMLADSTSRWAEALREVAGRLGEMRSRKAIPRISHPRSRRLLRACRARQTLCAAAQARSARSGADVPPGATSPEPVPATRRDHRDLLALAKRTSPDARITRDRRTSQFLRARLAGGGGGPENRQLSLGGPPRGSAETARAATPSSRAS